MPYHISPNGSAGGRSSAYAANSGISPLTVRLAAHVSNGWKSLIRPSSGKDTAKDKGVHREVESEGSRMANLWSDEQKSHQAIVKDKVATQTEVQ